MKEKLLIFPNFEKHVIFHFIIAQDEKRNNLGTKGKIRYRLFGVTTSDAASYLPVSSVTLMVIIELGKEVPYSLTATTVKP